MRKSCVGTKTIGRVTCINGTALGTGVIPQIPSALKKEGDVRVNDQTIIKPGGKKAGGTIAQAKEVSASETGKARKRQKE